MILPEDFRQGDPGSSEALQHHPVILEDLLLLRLRGAVRPVPPRLGDGVPGERWERELRVVPHIEPPLMPAVVRAGQGHWDVVITSTLLHSEVGAVDRRRPGTLLQARKFEEIPEKVSMRTDSQVPLTHHLECCHLLDVVRVEVLQLKPILEEDSLDESPGGDGEAALVESHERHHEPLRGARHGFITGNPPLHSGGEQRKLARLVERRSYLRDTLERVQFDITATKARAAEGARFGGVADTKKRRERDASAKEEDDGKAKS
jgi:hypothetical protein